MSLSKMLFPKQGVAIPNALLASHKVVLIAGDRPWRTRVNKKVSSG